MRGSVYRHTQRDTHTGVVALCPSWVGVAAGLLLVYYWLAHSMAHSMGLTWVGACR